MIFCLKRYFRLFCITTGICFVLSKYNGVENEFQIGPTHVFPDRKLNEMTPKGSATGNKAFGPNPAKNRGRMKGKFRFGKYFGSKKSKASNFELPMSNCPPSTKLSSANSSECISLQNEDVFTALNMLISPVNRTICSNITTVQGVDVCEDYIPANGRCHILSVISAADCNVLGSLEFEFYWSQRCNLTLLHYYYTTTYRDLCLERLNNSNINFRSVQIWNKRCFACLHYANLVGLPKIHLLKLNLNQMADKDGMQLKILADLYLYERYISKNIFQIVFRMSLIPDILIDYVSRDVANAWNIWAANQYLTAFDVFSLNVTQGTEATRLDQYDSLLQRVGLDPSMNFYTYSFVRRGGLGGTTEKKNTRKETYRTITRNVTQQERNRASMEEIAGDPPPYCFVPSSTEYRIMQDWIRMEVKVRCHPVSLWITCDRTRLYDSFIPCEKQLKDALAEDYAASKGWCDYSIDSAAIKPLQNVPSIAYKTFNKFPPKAKGEIRLAFVLNTHNDAEQVCRLLDRIYSKKHYYLIHIDKIGATKEFEDKIRLYANPYQNIFIVKEIVLVYGAATASILLAKSLAWYLKYVKHWDYIGTKSTDIQKSYAMNS